MTPPPLSVRARGSAVSRRAFGSAANFCSRGSAVHSVAARLKRSHSRTTPRVTFSACALVLAFNLTPLSFARADLVLRAEAPGLLSRFYRDQLGLVLVEEGPGGTVFDLGGERLIIVKGGRTNPESNLRLLVGTSDLDAVRTRLSEAGVPAEDLLDDAGSRFGLLFDDPEGNPLGVILPGASSSWPTEWRAAEPRPHRSSGRVEFAIWSGLHGVGLGFALPYSLGSDSPTVIGLAMMAAGPVAAVAGYRYAGHAGLTRGQARAIEFGGDFAMWQAFGWCGVADAESENALLWGSLGLVSGAVATALVTRGHEVSPAQAGLFLSAASWGGWFGLVGSRIADSNGEVTGDETLGTMLVASAAGGLAGGIAATAVDMEESRLAWINLAGVLGTAFGFGLDLVLQTDDNTTVWAVPAATGLGALVFTTWTTGRGDGEKGIGQLNPRSGQRGPGQPNRGFGHRNPGIGDSQVRWLPPSILPTGRGCRFELLRCRF